MKNLIKTVAFLLFIAITTSSFASGIYNPGKNYSADAVISNYIETTTMGNPANIENLFTDNFFQTVSTPSKVITHSKKPFIDYVKSQKGYVQNCQTSHTIIERNDNCAIAKITLTYKNFTKVEYVTVCSDGEIWKVSQVVTSYPKK
ncbi:nuclear transport factor 2 family protein [Sphingobacterium spiritivorum]|uniref:nuclear transport factor 2 family protein n=1 Tax=Sphingobacterium TaxID=28453 RepID=UPI0025D09908|nr:MULTISPECIES: nuclear transport factor 2 family protein [unclassified Sphingobacterium]